MKQPRPFFLALIATLCCLCCTPARTANVPTNAFEVWDDAVVALIEQSPKSGNWRLFCSAFFVAPSNILVTAAHCTDVVLTQDESDMAEIFGLWPAIEGREMAFVDWRSTGAKDISEVKEVQRATILAVDHASDLALLSVKGKALPHSALSLASDEPQQGDRIYTLGHTMAMPWSLSDGIIGAIRLMDGVRGDEKIKYVQTAYGANLGNSGGPLLSTDGKVLGVCSFKILDSSLTFYVHVDVLKEFLAANAISL